MSKVYGINLKIKLPSLNFQEKCDLQQEKKVKFFFVLCLIIGLSACNENPERDNLPVTVSNLEVERYMGLWHQVALIPNRFQDHCVSNTTAEYSLMEQGTIKVLNRCLDSNGKNDSAEGIARFVKQGEPSKLEVSFVNVFGWQLFWGDYWVLDIGKDYEYAVIGTPDRKYGWILARDKSLTDAQWNKVNHTLKTNDYMIERFVRSSYQ